MTDSVWPAKACRRSTMYQPTTAASTATIVPASSALTMNGKANSSRRSVIGLSESWVLISGHELVPVTVMVRRLRMPDDDQAAVGRPQHLDRRAVQLAQRARRDHLLDHPAPGAPAGQVDHVVEVAEQRVDVVG